MAFPTSPLPPSSLACLYGLYSAQQVRELDRCAIDDFGTPGIILMKRAGQAILNEILERFPEVSHISIFCGAGNNGGDGYIVAGLAKSKNIQVSLIETAGGRLKGDAASAREFARAQGVGPVDALEWLEAPGFCVGTIVVDALLGTGFNGEIGRPCADLISCINQSGLPVIAADIPSGLSADTGAVTGQAVRADVTITFIGMKIGLFAGQGRAFSGDIVFDGLEVTPDIHKNSRPLATLLDYDVLIGSLPERQWANHKGNHGHVVIVGGDSGFGGAPLMAAEAAARVGAGLVSVVTWAEHRAAILARRPEIMVCDAGDVEAVETLLARATAVVLGPGLNTKAWGQKLLQTALAANRPMVVDADALNLLAAGQFKNHLPPEGSLPKDSVMTPHPGEAGRLLGLTTQAVNRDRVAAVEQLQKQFSSIVLLKGSGTLIGTGIGTDIATGFGPGAGDSGIFLCPYGNPGMGSGGMGDVLSGVIGGLMAQGMSTAYAVKLGVCVHAYAADCIAREFGQRGLLATDLIDEIRRLINGL